MGQYLELSAIANSVVYEDSSSLEKSNSAIDAMYSIVRKADGQELSDLYKLLDHTEAKIWLAHQLVELHKLPKSIENKCFEIIEDLSTKNALDAFGEKQWLNEWGQKLGRT